MERADERQTDISGRADKRFKGSVGGRGGEELQ